MAVVDNSPNDVNDRGDLAPDYDLLPREEALVRLFEILGRLEAGHNSPGLTCPYSIERGPVTGEMPHRFRFGCCRGNAAN